MCPCRVFCKDVIVGGTVVLHGNVGSVALFPFWDAVLFSFSLYQIDLDSLHSVEGNVLKPRLF